MAVRVEVSEEIDRPAEVVFKFFAEDHVRNHPRWDPHVELWLDSEGPIGLGTIIRRRNSRSGTPIEGTMEVVEYEPDRAMGMVTHDGPLEIRGRATFEPTRTEITRLTLTAEIPEMDAAMESPMAEAVQGSLRTIKKLIESET